MNEAQAKERIRTLSEDIRHHNKLYHQQDQPEISDYEYDQLFTDLKKLEEEFPHLQREDSPSQSVGSAVHEQFSAVTHPYPMLSLANVLNPEEFLEWCQKREKDLNRSIYPLHFSPKLDGLALELIYEQGQLSLAATRGNGEVGENVSLTAKEIKNIPKKIPFNDNRLVIRGEVILTKKGLEKLNRQRQERDEKLFANPRNAAAGSIRQLNPEITRQRDLRFFAYQVANAEELSEVNTATHSEQLEFLKSLGFENAEYSLSINNKKAAMAYYDELIKNRSRLPYELDGVVIKIEKQAWQRELGVVGRRPRFAVAWKFPPEIKTTKLEDVLFQVGRTGAITPVGQVQAVNIGGATVQRVTLHNLNEINRLGIKIPCSVEIIRSGDVIPKILKVTSIHENASEVPFPKTCPVCSTALKTEREGVIKFCPNRLCPAKSHHEIVHFVSKDAMNIDGLGKEQIQEMLNKNIIQRAYHLYDLNEEKLRKMDRIGDKSIANLLTSIEKSKSVDLHRFIYALGLKGVGQQTAKTLAKKYQSVEKLLTANPDELIEVNDIGDILAQQISQQISEDHFLELINGLLDRGIRSSYSEKALSGPFVGKKVLFTGSLSMPRRHARERAEAAGAEVVSSISKNTDILIAGEKAGSKLNKARELGVQILSEAEFIQKLEKAGK